MLSKNYQTTEALKNMDFSNAITSTPTEKMNYLVSEDFKYEICWKREGKKLNEELCFVDIGKKDNLSPIGTERKMMMSAKTTSNDERRLNLITAMPIEKMTDDFKYGIFWEYESKKLVEEPCFVNTDDNLLLIGAEKKRMKNTQMTSNNNNRSSSSLLLEFDINGEKMVSKLCNSNNSVADLEDVNNKFANIKLNSENAYDLALELENIAKAGLKAADLIIKNSSYKNFNGMNYLCSRVKDNIGRKDSAVIKLQSQGLPWVIKSFIMSLLKIIEGWKILTDVSADNRKMKNAADEYQRVKIIETFKIWEMKTKVMLIKIHKTLESLYEGLEKEQKQHSSHIWNDYSSNKYNLIKDCNFEVPSKQNDDAQYLNDSKCEFQLVKVCSITSLDTENIMKIDLSPIEYEESNQKINNIKSYAEIAKIKNYSEMYSMHKTGSVVDKKYAEEKKQYLLPENFKEKRNDVKSFTKILKNRPPECHLLPKFRENKKMNILNDNYDREEKHFEMQSLQSYIVYNSVKKHDLEANDAVENAKKKLQLKDMQRFSKKIREKNINKTRKRYNK